MTTQRIVSGAHYGLRDWLGQRVTAIALTLYCIYLLIAVLTVPRLTYSSWYGLFLSPFMRVATLLAMLSLIYHAWIGIRDVLILAHVPLDEGLGPGSVRGRSFGHSVR